jgi:hypothetical protein
MCGQSDSGNFPIRCTLQWMKQKIKLGCFPAFISTEVRLQGLEFRSLAWLQPFSRVPVRIFWAPAPPGGFDKLSQHRQAQPTPASSANIGKLRHQAGTPGALLQSTPGWLRQAQPTGFDKLSLNRQAQPPGVGFPLRLLALTKGSRCGTPDCRNFPSGWKPELLPPSLVF